MKQALVFLFLISSSFLGAMNKDTTLMTIGDKAITLGEFEYLHHKNNQVLSEDDNSISDYVDLFVNFKLKVIEAEARGMDTVSTFVKELTGYRDQLAEPYLKDQDLDEQLIKEAYNRLKEEVEASHILVRVEENSTDTTAAYQKIMKARQEILEGADFASVAKKYSEDPSVVNNGGYLGYFTGFQMVLPFEEAAFNTPVGEISQPVRSRFGYHLIKVSDRRPSSGEINVSHILILANDKMSEEEKAKKKAQAFDIYNQLQEGEDFARLAEKFSEDHASSSQGGNIGFIHTGQTIPPFEKAAFALKEVGDISAPVQTRFGWHIIRLEARKTLPSFEDKYMDIKRRLARDERGTKPEKVFIAKLKKEYDYRINEEALKAVYAKVEGKTLDSTLRSELESMNETIMTYGDASKTQQDFIQYAWDRTKHGTNFESHFAEFEKQALLDYEKSRLELKYDDFRYLMNEYHDGLLLFEISNEMVWNKASQDEKGLAKFYKKNKKDYKFNEAYFGGRVFYFKDSLSHNTFEQLSATLGIEEAKDSLNKDEVLVKTEKGYYKAGENKAVDHLFFGKTDSTLYDDFALVYLDGESYEKGDIKPLEATRGSCISDYQNYLEEKWVKSLRRKYKVKVDKDLLATLEK